MNTGQAIRTKKKKGKTYVYLIEYYYEKTDSNSVRRERSLLSFGDLSLLEKENPNALNELKAKYNTVQNHTIQIPAKEVLEELQNGTTVNKSTQMFQISYKFSMYPGMHVWNNILKINNVINKYNKTIANNGEPVDYNKVLSYLCSSKIVSPGSLLNTVSESASQLFAPKDLSVTKFRRALELMNQIKDEVFLNINKQVDKLNNRDRQIIFFDTTNIYFETYFDELDKVRNKYMKDNLNYDLNTVQDIDKFVNDVKENSEAIRKLEESELPQRKRGRSKEHRNDLPLLVIALVMDSEGIPIDYKLFSGNIVDFSVVKPFIDEMKIKYNIKNSIFVADNGINSTKNLKLLNEEDMGFIVANSVYGLDKDMEKLITNLSTYKQIEIDFDDELNTDDLDLIDDLKKDKVIKYNTFPFLKNGHDTVEYVDEDGNIKNKKVPISINARLLVTYSEKRKKKDLNDLKKDIMNAGLAISGSKNLSLLKNNGWVSLVETEKVVVTDGKTKKPKSKKSIKAVKLNYDEINRRIKLAGFSATIYKEQPNSDNKLKIEDVIKAYHNLVKIELCFRLLKSDFNIRPVFIRSIDLINGHIALCVISLIVSKLMGIMLKNNGTPLTFNEIRKALNSANIDAYSSNGIDGVFERGVSLIDYNPMMKKEELEEYYQNKVDNKDDLSKVLNAIGLSNIEYGKRYTVKNLCTNLKTKSNYEEIVGTHGSNIQIKLSESSQCKNF